MLALRKATAAFGADLVEVEEPAAPGPGRVTVAVAAAGICGSDLHAFAWTPGYAFMTAFMPLTLGHEFSGTIRAVGEGVTALEVGDRVTCWPTVPCGACPACAADRPQDCQARAIVGLHADGAFAEQVVVPAANCRRLPDGLPLPVAALAEPLAVAVNAVDVAGIRPGDRVAVLGPGPIGLCIAFVAQQRGARVLLAGLDDAVRLERARALGIHRTADLAGASLEDAVRQAFDGQADRVIEATGAARSVADGLAVLRSGGVMTVAGIHSRSLDLDLTGFVRSKKQIRAAHDTTASAFDEAIRLLAAHADALGTLITHRRPLGAALEAFDLARSRRAVKVLLVPGAADTAGDER
ncbi:alcohol dehydrogenase catalytic domain-containing protein [Methylobacterium sp. NEAU 140]|uniref:zinc-dependent alcohol dehydrogenase n=1 Tax=Methylobacterium sp. NEAU 140 TaxID=3064945 RepID=UPI002732AD3B|nr:alcohol dehydrogenase catalytic domain-containing protein [Methylobacterium sp. NEAU 140]MDP4024648.1 alcohol dehydrogenase catalytic domain-containing protein [Methylobacterium sp. NEAU 140]